MNRKESEPDERATMLAELVVLAAPLTTFVFAPSTGVLLFILYAIVRGHQFVKDCEQQERG